MSVTSDVFYDESRVAIVPMGFCFPGLDAHGSDLPPRRECAPQWRARVMSALPCVELILLVGSYAQRWHLPETRRTSMTEVVRGWRQFDERPGKPRIFPLPHPSWRNNAWIKRNPWFAGELVPALRGQVRQAIGDGQDIQA